VPDPPSIFTKAIPLLGLRLPIHVTDVPVKVNEASAPVTVDCLAAPPLHPKLESLAVQPALKLTAAFDSSKRPAADGGEPPPPPPLVLSPLPPPPPPQEISMLASNKTPTRVVLRPLDTIKDGFTHNRAVCISKIISVGNAGQNGPDGLYSQGSIRRHAYRKTVDSGPTTWKTLVSAAGIRRAQDQHSSFVVLILIPRRKSGSAFNYLRTGLSPQ
jgi:hypothetical protein